MWIENYFSLWRTDKQLGLFERSSHAASCDNALLLAVMTTWWVIQPRKMGVNLDGDCIRRARKVNIGSVRIRVLSERELCYELPRRATERESVPTSASPSGLCREEWLCRLFPLRQVSWRQKQRYSSSTSDLDGGRGLVAKRTRWAEYGSQGKTQHVQLQTCWLFMESKGPQDVIDNIILWL